MTATESKHDGRDSSDGNRDLSELAAMVPAEGKNRIREIAFERSEPGDLVTLSELVREALAEHYDLPEVTLDE